MLNSSTRRIGAGSTRAPRHKYGHMPAAALQNIAGDMFPHEEHNPPLPLACASASSAVALLALLSGMCQAKIAEASFCEFNESWAFPGGNLSHDLFSWKASRATSRCSPPVMRGHDCAIRKHIKRKELIFSFKSKIVKSYKSWPRIASGEQRLVARLAFQENKS